MRAAINRIRSSCVFSITWMMALSAASVCSRARLSRRVQGLAEYLLSRLRRSCVSLLMPVSVHAPISVHALDLVIVDNEVLAPDLIFELLSRLVDVYDLAHEPAQRALTLAMFVDLSSRSASSLIA